MKGTSKNAPFDARLEFEAVEGGTRVKVDVDLNLVGPMKLFGGMITRSYGKAWERGLVRLKRMMEAGEL